MKVIPRRAWLFAEGVMLVTLLLVRLSFVAASWASPWRRRINYLPQSSVRKDVSGLRALLFLENWVTGARNSDKRLFLAELIHWFCKYFPLANYLLEGTKWWRISFLWPVQVRSSFLLLLPWPIHIMLHVSVHLSVLVTEVNSNCLQKVNFLTKSIPEICFTVELYSQIITLKCIFFKQCSGLIPA